MCLLGMKEVETAVCISNFDLAKMIHRFCNLSSTYVDEGSKFLVREKQHNPKVT